MADKWLFKSETYDNSNCAMIVVTDQDLQRGLVHELAFP